MGALTLKSFPFILRSWNVKSYESIDPTDSFGNSTRVYINKNQVVKIEPQFSNEASDTWLTDKGRQFFDGIFGQLIVSNTAIEGSSVKTSKQWESLFTNINKTFYIFNICNFKQAYKYFFILVFENVSIEVLSFLSLIAQTNSFIKIKRAEKLKVNSNLESSFQINSATSVSKLSSSSLCLLVGVNPRYEGSSLNLKLRQRYLKGNFRLLSIGSLLDLTFPVSFLGSNLSTLKNILEGNQTFCKDIINADNPILLSNTEVFKHSKSQEILSSFEILNYSNILNKVWNGFNVLNSSLYDTGLYTFSNFHYLTLKDLTSFSSLYVLNVNLNNVANLKTVTESRLLSYKSSNEFYNSKLFLNQSFNTPSSSFSSFISFKKYLYLPSSNFFENQETFINTEGYRKIGGKLVFRKNTKSDWQLLRKFVQTFSSNINLTSLKENKLIFYRSKMLFDFKNFINFHFQATQSLTSLNDYSTKTNQKFSIQKPFMRFKSPVVKLFDTKLKYWLDDFYTGGKDIFCQNSLVLIRCSNNNRLQGTTFF